MIRCTKCGARKSEANFYRTTRNRSGFRSWCRACCAADTRKWTAAHREQARAAAKRRYEAHPERYRAASLRWRAAHPERAREADLRGRLKRKYGATVGQVLRLREAQHGKCAICNEPLGPGHGTHVDHDHAKKIVRGLLCGGCNKGLGHFRDSLVIVARAARYLQKWQ